MLNALLLPFLAPQTETRMMQNGNFVQFIKAAEFRFYWSKTKIIWLYNTSFFEAQIAVPLFK